MSIEFKNRSTQIKLPELVLFDLDNTFYSYKEAHEAGMTAVQEKLKKQIGITEQDFTAAFDDARREVKNRLGHTGASHSRLLYFQRMIEKIGLRTQILLTLDLEQTYWRTFLANATLFPKSREFLEELTIKGISRAIVTDLTSQIQFRKLIYFSIDTYFDLVVTSEEAGVDKPDQKIFDLAIEKFGKVPSCIWMIGDDLVKDIHGASKALNCVTIQKRHSGVTVGNNESMADIVFDSFDEIIKYFQDLS